MRLVGPTTFNLDPLISGASSSPSTGFLLLIVFVSGVFWPLEALPYYLRWFSRALPFTVPGESFRTILIRKGAPFSLIMPGMLMSVLWLIIFSLLSLYSFKRMRSS